MRGKKFANRKRDGTQAKIDYKPTTPINLYIPIINIIKHYILCCKLNLSKNRDACLLWLVKCKSFRLSQCKNDHSSQLINLFFWLLKSLKLWFHLTNGFLINTQFCEIKFSTYRFYLLYISKIVSSPAAWTSAVSQTHFIDKQVIGITYFR